MQPRNQKFLYVLAVLLLLGGAGILFFSAATQNAVYFLNVAEARVLPDRYEKPIRLFGEVVRHDLREGTARLGVKFTLQDKDQKDLLVHVVYAGAVPDTIKSGIEVILEGCFDQKTEAFVATSMMTKCPSKYKANSEGKLRPPGYKS